MQIPCFLSRSVGLGGVQESACLSTGQPTGNSSAFVCEAMLRNTCLIETEFEGRRDLRGRDISTAAHQCGLDKPVKGDVKDSL